MGYTLIDLTGKRFGKLTVLRRADDRINKNGTHRTMWVCKCDCGNTIVRGAEGLRRGETTHCGCMGRKGVNFIGALKPLPAPLTVQNRLAVGQTYTVKGKRLRLIGIYNGFARFEDRNGFHECYMFSELEGKL